MSASNGAATSPLEVTEYTDPGCPWSWASEPRIRWARRRYGDHVAWRRVFGVQLDGPEGADADESPDDVRRRWLSVAERAQAPLTGRLLRAHASTRPADRVAKAAELHGPAVADAVLRRLREAFFVIGNPPDSRDALALALDGLAGLDVDVLLDAAESPETLAAIEADFEEARRPDPLVIDLEGPGPHAGAARDDGHGRLRYGFPTLVISGPAGRRIVPGWRDPSEYREAFEALDPGLAQLPDGDVDGADALARHATLSVADLELLGVDASSLRGAVRVQTATTPLWATPEAAEHIARARLAAAPA